MPTRNEILLGSIDRTMEIIEIGPSFAPVTPKAEGWNVRSIDHLSREALVEKYNGQVGVDTSRIEEVDFIWTGGPLCSAVPESLHGSFDALIASHVIEHSPDLIGFLQSIAKLVSPNGLVALAVPDKRYCFDYFKPLTMTGDVLEAHAQQRTRHSRANAFKHVAYSAAMSGLIAWTQQPVRDLSLVHSLAAAKDLYNAVSEEADALYHDVHAWHFTPSSFELLFLELGWLGEIDWRVERTSATEGCEFLAWLRRGGQQVVQNLSATELAARRLELLKRTLIEAREQVGCLLEDSMTQACNTPMLGAAVTSPVTCTAESAPCDNALNSQFVDSLQPELAALRAESQHQIALSESIRRENALLEARLQQTQAARQMLLEEAYRLWNSGSWQIFRPLRNVIRRLRGYEKEVEPTTMSDIEALQIAVGIRQSLSWEVTAPLRIVHRILSPFRRSSGAVRPAADAATPLPRGQGAVPGHDLRARIAGRRG
jgi:hypothetical protein